MIPEDDPAAPQQAGTEAWESFANGGLYCAESVLMALARRQGIATDNMVPLATGFCSGIARTKGMCGAVSGAVMGLGLVFGRRKPTDSREPTYQAVRTLLDRFTAEFGSTNCFELLGCDLATEEGQREFRQRHLLSNCQRYVRRATELAAEISPVGTKK
jgi:C_GCAxxG_C_C family probable redox protein